MTVFNRRIEPKLDSEAIAAIWLILIFSGWLLLNFWSGFNLLMYIFVAFFGVVLSLIQPRAGLYSLTFLFLIFTSFFTLQPLVINQQEYKFYLVDILFSAMLIGMTLRLAKKNLKIKLHWPDIMLIAFLLLTAIYFFLSISGWQGNFALAFSSFKNYAFYPLFYFAAYLLLDNRSRLKTWLMFVMAGAVGIVGFIVYGLLTGQGLWTELTPLSTAGSRILDFDHAFYLCLIVLFALAFLVYKKGLARGWFYVLLPLFTVGIVGSLMRHLWLALAAAVVAMVLFVKQNKRGLFGKILLNYGIVIVMLGIVAIFLANVLPFSRFSLAYQSAVGQVGTRAASLAVTDDSSIAWRSAVWQSVWDKFKTNIVGGLGFGQQVFIDMGDYRDYVDLKNMHNSFLAIFAQMGLLGFAVFGLFGVGVFAKLLKFQPAGDTGQTARLALLGIMVFCACAFLFQPYLEANFFNIPFWLSLGLAKRTYEGAFG